MLPEKRSRILAQAEWATPPPRSATSWLLRCKKNAHHFVESRLRAGSFFALGQAGLQLGQAAPILPPPLGKLIATMATSGSLLSTFDFVVFFGALLAIMAVGLWVGRREKSSKDYFWLAAVLVGGV